MLIEEIRTFVPVENEETGETFMLPVVSGLRFKLSDSVTYGKDVGTPTTFTYSFRTKRIVHYPAQVAETDKYSRPKRLMDGSIVWQVVREQSFTVDEFLTEFSYSFAEPILNRIGDDEDKRETLKDIKIRRREIEEKKSAKRAEKRAEMVTLLQELFA